MLLRRHWGSLDRIFSDCNAGDLSTSRFSACFQTKRLLLGKSLAGRKRREMGSLCEGYALDNVRPWRI